MLGPEFASCWLKLGRAEEHANTFCRELKAWVDSDPYVIGKKVNTDGSRHSNFIKDIKTNPPLDRWSCIVGDCIHNLRSALDHFIYAAAIRESGRIPLPTTDRCSFQLRTPPQSSPDKRGESRNWVSV